MDLLRLRLVGVIGARIYEELILTMGAPYDKRYRVSVGRALGM